MSAYYIEMDVIQRTWYGSTYHVRVDLHIECYKSVDRTILFDINDGFF